MLNWLFPGFFGKCGGPGLLPLLFLLDIDKCDPCHRRCGPCGRRGFFY